MHASATTEEVRVLQHGSGTPVLWIVAGVHGDEVEGMACVEEVLSAVRPRVGTLVAVPVAHPAALRAGTRRGPDGVDLNRIYPGRPDGGPTERVANALWRQMVDSAPDALMTIHSWSRSGSAVAHVEHARGDARGAELAARLGLPFVVPFLWPDGLLPNVSVKHGIPSVELELGGLGAQTPGNLRRGLHAVQAIAAALGMCDPPPVALTPVVVHRVPVPVATSGRVRQRRELGETVRSGDPICEIRDMDGSLLETLTSPVRGWVGVHVTYGYVKPGDEVVIVFEADEAAA
jgi:predicted deacylase